jgi:Cu+-exporting ATPase
VFFETPAVLLTLVMLGRTLEVLAKGKASQVLSRMIELQPATALLMQDPTEEARDTALISAARTAALNAAKGTAADGWLACRA